eukprot:c34827_g1_i1 orf=123-371(+)
MKRSPRFTERACMASLRASPKNPSLLYRLAVSKCLYGCKDGCLLLMMGKVSFRGGAEAKQWDRSSRVEDSTLPHCSQCEFMR